MPASSSTTNTIRSLVGVIRLPLLRGSQARAPAEDLNSSRTIVYPPKSRRQQMLSKSHGIAFAEFGLVVTFQRCSRSSSRTARTGLAANTKCGDSGQQARDCGGNHI